VKKDGSDKPDLRNTIERQMCGALPGSGFKVFAGMIGRTRPSKVWAIPATKGGEKAPFEDRMNSGAGRRPAGIGYIFGARARRARAGPQFPRPSGVERTDAIRNQIGLANR